MSRENRWKLVNNFLTPELTLSVAKVFLICLGLSSPPEPQSKQRSFHPVLLQEVSPPVDTAEGTPAICKGEHLLQDDWLFNSQTSCAPLAQL